MKAPSIQVFYPEGGGPVFLTYVQKEAWGKEHSAYWSNKALPWVSRLQFQMPVCELIQKTLSNLHLSLSACPIQLQGNSLLQHHALHWQPQAQHSRAQQNPATTGPLAPLNRWPKFFTCFSDRNVQCNTLPTHDTFANLTQDLSQSRPLPINVRTHWAGRWLKCDILWASIFKTKDRGLAGLQLAERTLEVRQTRVQRPYLPVPSNEGLNNSFTSLSLNSFICSVGIMIKTYLTGLFWEQYHKICVKKLA